MLARLVLETFVAFAVVVQEHALAQLLADPEAGIDFSRVVHADQRFTHARPIVVNGRVIGRVRGLKVRLSATAQNAQDMFEEA